MDPALLRDPGLWFIMLLAGAVSLLTALNVAARPAAILTGKVALAFSISQVFFMITRFANLFYLPLMARHVDEATRTGRTEILYGQIQWVIVGAAGGAFLSWVLLPTFVEVYRQGIQAMDRFASMTRVLVRMLHPSAWMAALRALRRPSNLGISLFRLEGVPADFLLVNVAASAIWTVGALCAVYVSAIIPQYKSTAVLLSGLVNAFAAIAFSIWVDPRAAVITDQVIKGERKPEQVSIVAVHLAAGNFLGGCLGLVVFYPGVALIQWATLAVGSQGESLVGSLWLIVLLNVLFALMASTTYSSRVSAVVTRKVASALAIYNLFFLITRLAGQIYAPILGALSDHVVSSPTLHLGHLTVMFRWVLLGSAVGACLGWLLMPTFVEVYNRAIEQLNKKNGSVPAVIFASLNPRNWTTILSCLRRPSLFGLRAADYRRIPRGFILANVLVIAVHTVGVVAAIYAGANLDQELARTATLLSSVVNGIATITLSIVVDPMSALITDQTVKAERPTEDIYAMAVLLMGGMLLGTLLSQLILLPAAELIGLGARLLDALF
ncbi:MAG: DUF2837 family protein [Armatimonadetes bacterium]|nr:DUF2837 family protein [Armatimonadota bacterium]